MTAIDRHDAIPEQADGRPPISGYEPRVHATVSNRPDVPLDRSGIDFDRVGAGFAIALHMHQPMVPAAGELTTAPLISNLQHMLDHSDEGENHNAPMFIDCYERMGRIIPELVEAGHRPRVMLEYSGCLLWGLQQMGRGDVIESLRRITTDDRYWPCVEWLGMPWGHPVAPSTPAVDFRRHVQAHQQHFAGLFGLEALSRVRGFSPPEMALPNHPDLAYEFVKALRDFGYQWVLVQEHTVERPGGGPVTQPHLPRRLVCRNSRGEVAEITAIIKTQGSDTKLVGQMQPYYEACGLGRVEVSGRSIPPLVTQISDGENGGVIMNEFPGKYLQVMRQAPGSDHPPINVSEYLAYLHRAGVGPGDFEPVQPLMQHRVWANFEDAGPNALDDLIVRLERDDPAFQMEGGSWTSDRSWVAGYEHVLGPMETASMMFRERVDPGLAPTDDDRYRNALYHLLLSQTSCYRYWGGGIWTERGREICRRAMEIIRHDFPVEVG